MVAEFIFEVIDRFLAIFEVEKQTRAEQNTKLKGFSWENIGNKNGIL